ncbi:MAG: hypothetical protein ACLQVD_20565 [Capsulimonadaceae bacterium]
MSEPYTLSAYLSKGDFLASLQRSHSSLPGVKRRFQSGDIAAGTLFVKPIPFNNDEGKGQPSVVWLVVNEWDTGMIVGRIAESSADRGDIQLGRIMMVEPENVLDWKVVTLQGVEGGDTDRLSHPTPQSPTVADEEKDVPAYVRRRGDPDFVKRVTEAGRAQVRAEMPSHGMAYAVLFAGPVAFALAAFLCHKWLGVSGLCALAAIWQLRSAIRQCAKVGKGLAGSRDLVEHGEFCVGMLLMMNAMLHEPGMDASALVLIVTDRNSDLIDVYDGVSEGASDHSPTSDRAVSLARSGFEDERYVRNRRWRMPNSWTRCREAYACCLYIKREYLPSGVVTSPFVPCLATPGDDGAITLLPWDLVEKAM